MTTPSLPKDGYVLVTGGAGYIGSHCALSLIQAGHRVVILDNLYNASYEAIRRVARIAGVPRIPFQKASLLEPAQLRAVFKKYPGIWAVVHLASAKAVGESVRRPLDYYHINVTGTINLLQAMAEAGVYNLVFSSSATVYGDPEVIPIPETCPLKPESPYGRTKVMIETIVQDVCNADSRWNAALLRYFNPTGAHESGLMGENPKGVPYNLMPYLAQVAVGKREYLSVFGNDYESKDGTGIRDYIHVVDLADGHLAALEKLRSNPGCVIYNLGNGEGYTVLEMIAAFSRAVGRDLPYKIAPRRPGDVTNLTADPSKANAELGWRATKGLDAMCADLWRWQSNNPNGYEGGLEEPDDEEALVIEEVVVGL